MTVANLAAVRALIADAEPVPDVRRFNGDPKPGSPRGDMAPGGWHPDALGLPPDCPITPLGYDGALNWCLDPVGQLVAYTEPYGKAATLTLFRGRDNFLKWAWPRYGKDTNVDSWKNDDVAAAIVAACTAKGAWSQVEKVRGRGTWLGRNGELVVHVGNKLIVNGRDMPPGEVDGFVYPTRPRIPGPWPETDSVNPARELRRLLQTWAWSRPDVDPQLFLGWVGVAMLGAALPWRSTVFITGDKGAGKSTLQELIKGLLGDALIHAADTSAAGIYQHVGQDCLPVAIDELEGEADTRKQKAVLKLARLASSGALMLRGGDRHQGVEFQARSAFLFSSINTPPLEPQDLSRMALLQLRKLEPGQAKPDLGAGTLAVLGRCLLRRVMDEWPRFHQTWDAYREELAAAGMDGRGQDTFGTLLACADLLEHKGWDPDRLSVATLDGDVRPWREVMRVSSMIEFDDATENWRLCLQHLLSVPVEAWRNGTRITVGQVLSTWANQPDEYDRDITKVKTTLGSAGLSMQREVGQHDWLVVPNQNPLTRKLFEGSKWGGDMGAGVWVGALRQAPPELYKVGQGRVNGVKSKCTLVSLDALYGRDGIMTEVPSLPPLP